MNKYVTTISKGDSLFAMPIRQTTKNFQQSALSFACVSHNSKSVLGSFAREKFKMNFAFLLLSFAVANLFKATVDGALMINETVFCSRIEPRNTARVCAVAMYSTPYLEQLDNGTEVWLGGYKNTYTIVKGLKEGDVYDVYAPDPMNDAGIIINVAFGDADICTVSVADSMYSEETVCNKCKYCGKDSYKADCSNVKNGRNMTSCVKVAKDVVADAIFFPLNTSALPKAPRRPPVPAPIKPPTKAPIKSPTKAPQTRRTMSPTRAPRKMSPVRSPRATSPARSPVTRPRAAPVPTP